jgi:hypothetical protein
MYLFVPCRQKPHAAALKRKIKRIRFIRGISASYNRNKVARRRLGNMPMWSSNLWALPVLIL